MSEPSPQTEEATRGGHARHARYPAGKAHKARTDSMRSSSSNARSARSPERSNEAINRRSPGERRLKSTRGFVLPAQANPRTVWVEHGSLGPALSGVSTVTSQPRSLSAEAKPGTKAPA